MSSGQSASSTSGDSIQEEIATFLQVLPGWVSTIINENPRVENLVEVILDLGCPPKAVFTKQEERLSTKLVSKEDLLIVQGNITPFGKDNRAGIDGQLHRISCLRNRENLIIGLTLRVGREINISSSFLHSILKGEGSILLLGKPGLGKTTLIREMSRYTSQVLKKRVLVIDSSNEIGGGGDIPHPAIGDARRMMVQNVSSQAEHMLQGVKNHTPDVLVIDEIGGKHEAISCERIARRGVALMGTAHGDSVESLISNPDLVSLIGGIQSVILGDTQATKMHKQTGAQFKKSVMETKGTPTFHKIVQIVDHDKYIIHETATSVAGLLQNMDFPVKVCNRDDNGLPCITSMQYRQARSIMDCA